MLVPLNLQSPAAVPTQIVVAFSIAIDAMQNVYTTGYFKGIVDFDPNAGIHNLSGTGNNNYFLFKLDSAGDFSWVNQLSDLKGITLDDDGNIYSTGYFTATFA